MIVIEDGISIPTDRGSAGRTSKYPFGTIEVGQSFALPREEAARLGHAAKIWKKRHPGWNYVTRIREDAVRFWRVE